MVVEFVVKLGLGKDKLEFSKFEERGACEGNHTEDNGNDNRNDSEKSALSNKDKLEGKAVRLGLSARGAEAKEVENEKKPVEYFLCHGPHRRSKDCGNLRSSGANQEDPIRSIETRSRRIKSVPFRGQNEGIVRMGGGYCHRPEFKAHDHLTQGIPWRSIIDMWTIFLTRVGMIQRAVAEACQNKAWVA
ncbi:hypothetical protein J1N35_022974 [Gossypium stocksii]|uniref:Uncharacterized protein n=1 Tax=Gossypium stocksii TaxID=47602 RepID=A0A9D4A2R0_9ROSI|nr:hypothetical protein J1N35_022974 [Gossypium stocksii]